MTKTIPFQPELVQSLPQVRNNKEYREYAQLLERMDEIIRISGLDLNFACHYLNKVQEQRKRQQLSRLPGRDSIQRIISFGIRVYRCNIIHVLLNKPFRELSIMLAESARLRAFCNISSLDESIRVPSKSSLKRYSDMIDEPFLRDQVNELLQVASQTGNPLNLRDAFTAEDVYVDLTCLKAKIHYPVDWILLKDGMHTILQTIIVIRKHGLKHRITDPKTFITRINALCMTMTSLSRKRDGKKLRKKTFRKLKELARVIRKHACTYKKILAENWQQATDLHEGQVRQIVDRLNAMISLLPQAVQQANKRIISEKKLKNCDKLLSLYHQHINVINRGKAGAQVEFGNTLFLAEQADGFILDWQLYPTDRKDPQATREAITRMLHTRAIHMKSVTGDRGCQSKLNDKLLQKNNIYNGLCPRNPHQLIERLADPEFRKKQKRRAHTEGRIGILKNRFLGGSLYERSFEGKTIRTSMAVLVHNLWVLARLPQKTAEEPSETNLKKSA